MDIDATIRLIMAVLPVLVLLFTFDRLDVFDLIIFRVILFLVGVGAILALPSFLVNALMVDVIGIDLNNHRRYFAPLVEESLKTIPILVMFAHNRLGYKLDAGIAGFAVGAGFAVAENIYYLNSIQAANMSVWLVRGFGTAVMHGGATALFAIIAQQLYTRQAESDASHYEFRPVLFLPGLIAAILVHSAFNHFLDQPVLLMAATLLAIPLVLFLVFYRNQGSTQRWLESDAANHRQELADLLSGAYRKSSRGKKIEERLAGVEPELVDKAFTYVEVKTALILRAEEMIIAAHEDESHDVQQGDVSKFLQLEGLERDLGRDLVASIEPVLGFTRNDLWELSRLQLRVFKQRR